MKNDAPNMNPERRTHPRLRVVVSSCLVAVFVVMLAGFLVLGGARSPQDSQSQDAAQSQVSQDDSAQNDDASSSAGGSDEELGYVHDEMLLSFEPGTSASELNARIASLDCAVTEDVSDQNLDAGYVLIELREGSSVEDAVAAAEQAGLVAQPNFIYTLAEGDEPEEGSGSFDVPIPLSEQEEENVNEFLASGALEASSAVTPEEKFLDKQWALWSVDAFDAWAIERCGVNDDGTAKSNPISVAVIDTGIVSHEDLDANVKARYNSNSKTLGAEAVKDTNGHGTHVAGIVSAVSNNDVGVSGVAYNAGLVAINAVGSDGNFSTLSLSNAFTWLFSTSSQDKTKTNAEYYNVRVVNMSLGGARPSPLEANDELFESVITQAYRGVYTSQPSKQHASILSVVAAGNKLNGVSIPYVGIPADSPDVVSVINLEKASGWSETNNDVRRYLGSGQQYLATDSGSNYNCSDARVKNISAPGTDIYSTSMSGAYVNKTGTSMASPLVAGISALVFSERPDLTAQQVADLLYVSATDMDYGVYTSEGGVTSTTTASWDRETGYGEVNAYHALQLVSAKLAGGETKLAEYGTVTSLMVEYGDGSGWETYGGPDQWEWSIKAEDGTSETDIASLTIDAANKTVALEAHKLGTVKVIATLKSADGKSLNSGITMTQKVKVGYGLSKADVSIVGTDFTYSGFPITPRVSVSLKGKQLAEGTDCKITYDKNIDAGTAVVDVEGIGDYQDSVSASFVIKPASIAGAAVEVIADQGWTGSAVTPVPRVTVNGAALQAGRDFDITYENNVNEGSAKLSIVAKGNYAGTLTRQFNIVRASLQNATVEVATQRYTGSPLMPDLTVKLDGKILIRGEDYRVDFFNNTNPGLAEVKVVGIGCYTGEKRVYFDIVATEFPGTITVNGTQTYTGRALEPSLTVKVGSTVLKQGVDYEIDGYSNNVNVGTAVVSVIGKGAYAGVKDQQFAIVPRSISDAAIQVDAQLYTGNPRTPNPVVTVSGLGTLVKDRDYTVSYANNVNAGTGTVTVTGKGNFTGTASKGFAISAISAISAITPSGQGSGASQGDSAGDSGSGNVLQGGSQPSRQTGSWVSTGGRWWFAYDTVSKSSQGKSYPANEWVAIGGKQYHFDSAGWMHSGWQWIDNAWYYFGSDGAMKTGWQKVGGKWYYMASDGRMQTGKHDIGGQTYYLASSGAMMAGWVLEGSTWYYHSSSGAMVKGWARVGGTWYYLGSDGAMYTERHVIGGQTYFFTSSGAMRTGWVKDGADWYYCSGSGAMQTSRWIGNYYVGADGVMATDEWIGIWHVNASGRWDKTR